MSWNPSRLQSHSAASSLLPAQGVIEANASPEDIHFVKWLEARFIHCEWKKIFQVIDPISQGAITCFRGFNNCHDVEFFLESYLNVLRWGYFLLLV